MNSASQPCPAADGLPPEIEEEAVMEALAAALTQLTGSRVDRDHLRVSVQRWPHGGVSGTIGFRSIAGFRPAEETA